MYPFNIIDIQEDGLDQSMSKFNGLQSFRQGVEFVLYMTLSTLQQSVGCEAVFRHTVEQLLMRAFYAPSTERQWRQSSPTFQRYISNDRVFKLISSTNRCDWYKLFHSDLRRIAGFSSLKANGKFPKVEYSSVKSRTKNMHSSENFEYFFQGLYLLWNETLLKTDE